MPETQLKYKTISSLTSSYAIEIFRLCISVLSKIILARLLLPEVFGVFAVSFAVVNITKVILSLELGNQFIRQKDVYYGDYLITEILLSTGAIVVIWTFFSVFKFYDPRITLISKILILSLIPYSLNLIPQAYAYKELEIKRMLIPNSANLISYFSIAVILAVLNKGIWALVVAQLASEAILCLFMWWKFGPYIKLNFSKDRTHIFKAIWNAKYLYVISLIGVFFAGLDKIILGKYLNSTIVGFYSVAMALSLMPTGMIEGALNLVFYPLFSKIKDETDKVKNVYTDLTVLLYIIEVPLYAFIFFNAGVIIKLLLGEKWLGASIYLKYMALFPIFHPWTTFGIQIMKAKKKEYIELILTSISLSLLFLMGVFFTKRYGGIGMIVTMYILYGYGISYAYFINRFVGAIINIVKRLFPIYVVSFLCMAVPNYLFKDNLLKSSFSLALLIALYLIFYKKIAIPVLYNYYGKDKVNVSNLINYLRRKAQKA